MKKTIPKKGDTGTACDRGRADAIDIITKAVVNNNRGGGYNQGGYNNNRGGYNQGGYNNNRSYNHANQKVKIQKATAKIQM